MRTVLEDPPTKQKLLDAAQKLVLTNGFAATTVDDICHAAKLTKGSFFHYFETKEDLGVELLKRYCASSKEAFLSGCRQTEKDPLARVYGFLDFVIRMAAESPGGCLLGSMAQELSDTHPEIRSISAKGFHEMAELLSKDLAEAKARYVPKAAWSPRELADHFVAVLEGAMLLAKVRKDTSLKESSLKHFKEYLKGLFAAQKSV